MTFFPLKPFIDLDHIPGIICPVDDNICAVQDNILPVIDPDQPVTGRVRNGIGPRVKDDPGVTVNINVICHVKVGLGMQGSQPAESKQYENEVNFFHGREGLKLAL